MVTDEHMSNDEVYRYWPEGHGNIVNCTFSQGRELIQTTLLAEPVVFKYRLLCYLT